jgi:hypothetical protein
MTGSRRTNEITQALLMTSAAYAKSIAMGEAPEQALASVLAAFIPRAVLLAIPGFGARKSRESATWWTRVCAEIGDDPDKVREEVETRMLTDGLVSDTVVAAYNSLLAAIDPAVIPTLSALTAEYLVPPGKQRDLFFVQFSGLLTELGAEHMRALHETVAYLIPLELDMFSLFEVATDDGNVIVNGPSGGGGVDGDEVCFVTAGVGLTLFALFRRHGLAVTGKWNSDGEGMVMLARQTVERINSLVRV